MTTCLLIRHGQSQANVDGVLAGHLDSPLTEEGVRQARRVREVLRELPLRRVVTSPLTRCRATAAEIIAAHPEAGVPHVDDRFAEVHYGAWTGRRLQDLGMEDLWKTIQVTPSAVTFPAHPDHRHESMTALDERSWAAWQDWNTRIGSEEGDRAVWAVVSHGDVIKALLARALGLDLDAFQSLVVDPGTVNIVHHHAHRTAVSGMNLRDDIFTRLVTAASAPEPAAETEPSVGVVGGGNA